MKQNNKIEFHIPLIFSVSMLLAMMLPTLSLPYCYSETQLLGDSIFYLMNHGIGAVFCNNDVQLPDLFSLIFSYVTKYLGSNPWILHSITLIFSAFSIIIAYKFGKFFCSVQAGVMAAGIMCTQNVFVAQSGLILPIMMLNCSILGAFYFFYREKYNWCMIASSAATLIDITGFASAIFMFVAHFKMKYREWTVRQNIMMTIPIALWFLYQFASIAICGKITIRNINFDWMNWITNLRFIAVDQYRIVITGILAIILIVNMINKQMQYFVKDMANNGIILMVIYFAVNSVFGDSNSWNLPAISMLMIFTGCTISTLHVSYYYKYIIACSMMMASAMSAISKTDFSDAHVNYKSKIKVDLKTVRLIEENAEGEEVIFCDKYFQRFITVKELGYRQGAKNYECVTSNEDIFKIYNWTIYSNFDPTESLKLAREDGDYEKRSTIYIEDCCNEIYQLK
ncbi:MAG: hypothetical protein MJZ61_04625 [Bacteroidales bacterium]|nr:hypothetical protein [Bacteroidales bacterium]